MKYDFDRVIERRGSDSVKWDGTEWIFGSSDVLPMWVADMDFPVAGPIVDALRQRLEHPVFGYTQAGTSLKSAVAERLIQKYGWKVSPEWMVFTPGVVPALTAAVRAFTAPGDEVVIQSPVYYPFWDAIRHSGCQVVNNPLMEAGERYIMDIEGLKRAFGSRDGMAIAPNRVCAMILCNPHNPVGRVWSKNELEAVGHLAARHGAVVLSDEIHCELLFGGVAHTPFASISEEFANASVTFMAPSKTFNLAGLSASIAIIPNDGLRTRFQAATAGSLGMVNTLGLTAFEAAYRHGDEWLGQLLGYLESNLNFLIDRMKQEIPEIRVFRPEGTYLVWMDFRALGLEPGALREFLRAKARVGLDDGYVFGPGGEGFARMNIACPRSILEEGLRRIVHAVRKRLQ